MKMKFFSATSKTKRQINANDKSAIMTVAVAVVLLGAFFVINPINLTAFAAVDPVMVKKVTGDGGPIHPGEFLTEKIVNFTNSTGELITITPAVNVTINIFNATTQDDCVDLLGNIVLNFTTDNVTTNIITPNSSSLFYTETFVGMPGVYHCEVEFIAANVTTASDTQSLGNQTVWIDAIGTLGFWKNHANATDQHLPINLGGFLVPNNETATPIFKEHRGPLSLEKVAAQLLAAALNVWAIDNATKTSCITDTISGTNATLVDRGYDGPENDINKINKRADRPFFMELGINHTDLDDFNNGGCPLP